MDFTQLKTFITIVKFGSFTKAAEILDYAQSSISGQVRALEEEFEIRLFERSGREVVLTDEGKNLLVYAEQLVKLAEEAKDSITGSTVPKGTLTIGAPESVSIFRLPEILREYRKRFPKVKLILKLGSCTDILDWLKKNIIDVAFLLDTPLNISGYISQCLFHEEIRVISGINSKLADKDAIEASDFEGEDLVLVDEGHCCYRKIFEAILAEAGAHPGSIQEFGSVETIKKCVISGLGISILPYIAVEREIENGQLKSLPMHSPDYNIYTQMLYRRNKWLSPNLSALIELSKQKLIL